MKLDQLQYFVETARRQHIGLAAKFLNISPSAISHSISALEEEFGQKLFEKQGRQIKLTHHGKLLLDRAEFLLAEVARMGQELSSDKIELSGHFRIAATHFLSSEILTPVWMKIQSDHPNLRATLLSLKSGDVLSQVTAGEVDLGFCLSPYSGPNIERELIHQGNLLIAMGSKHPFLKNPKIEDLASHPSIAALGAQGIDNCENHPSFQKLRVTQRVVNFFDSYQVAVESLRLNNVWTLLPDFIAQQNKDFIQTYTPRGWEATYQLVAIWPKYRLRTTALDLVVERFKETILQSLRQK
ncbi:MAG TPA: LysR family transcriptional regulator [Bacteriovoracaceae bacterium]|nr:LysR family transcriptional regulator [Bacteriovoracaceae bacterium]